MSNSRREKKAWDLNIMTNLMPKKYYLCCTKVHLRTAEPPFPKIRTCKYWANVLCWHSTGMCVCVSAVCLFLTTKGLGVITSMCRMDSQNRQYGVVFVLMSRFPDCMLLNVETIITGKLPESRVINCDSFVLNDPCLLLSRPVSRAKHVQDASADIHGHVSGIQGDLLRHHATGAADWSWWRWGFCHWRYKHLSSNKSLLSTLVKSAVSFSQATNGGGGDRKLYCPAEAGKCG